MKRLYRSQRDKKLFGVCGGIADAIGMDPTIVRLIVVITAVLSGGAPIPIYIIAAFVIPKEPLFQPPEGPYGQPAWGKQHEYNSYGSQPARGFYPPNNETSGASIDEMMKDLEKKALEKEVQELKEKLAKLEKGER